MDSGFPLPPTALTPEAMAEWRRWIEDEVARQIRAREAIPPMMEEAEVAKLLHFTVGAMRMARFKGKPILPFVKVGRKTLYRREEVEAFLRCDTNHHTTTRYGQARRK